MYFILNYNSGQPMYDQIKEHIKQDIYTGKLKHNDLLPSVRQLAKDLNVSMITTKRAYLELENEGFIYSVAGKGTFVNAQDFSKILVNRNDQLLKQFEEKVKELEKSGIEKSKIIAVVESVYSKKGDEE